MAGGIHFITCWIRKTARPWALSEFKGFYFTVSKPGFAGDKLLFEMLRYGMAGIPLSTTGSTKEGIRICVSLIKDDQVSLLDDRLVLMNNSILPTLE